MTLHTAHAQIAFRYRAHNSANGVNRETVKRLAHHLGVDETQAIHIALRDLVARVLPQYEADEGALSATQLKQIRAAQPKKTKRSVRSSLFEAAGA